MHRLRWALALTVALLVFAPDSRAQLTSTTTTTTTTTSTSTTTTTTPLITIPTTTEPSTTTTEPAATTTEPPTSTTQSTTSSTNLVPGTILEDTPSTTAAPPLVVPTTVTPSGLHDGGLSTDTIVRLVVGALLLIAVVLGGITVWIWRQTDPRRRFERVQ